MFLKAEYCVCLGFFKAKPMKTQKQTNFFTEFHSKVTILTEPAVSSALQLSSQPWGCTELLLQSILSCLPIFSLMLLQFCLATLLQNTCKKRDVFLLALTSDRTISELCYIWSPLSCNFSGSPALCVWEWCQRCCCKSCKLKSAADVYLRHSLVSSVNFLPETVKG